LIAATTGRGKVSSRRSPALTRSHISKIRGASSGVACDIRVRLPPAKKVFLALVTTTPVTCSISSWSRSTAAAIDSTYSSFIVLAPAVGSSIVRVTIPASSRS
jgi:hypothetical protein